MEDGLAGMEIDCATIHQSDTSTEISAPLIRAGPYAGGVRGGSKEPPFLTERSTIFNDELQKILLQTLNFHFKTKFGKKTGRENGLLSLL